jgi:hypothetical protein
LVCPATLGEQSDDEREDIDPSRPR